MDQKLIRAMQMYHLSRRGGVLLVSILLVKMGMSTEDIGIFETWMYLLMLFSFFWVESLIKAFLSLVGESKDHSRTDLVFSLYLLFASVSVILGGLFLLLDQQILWLTTGSDTLSYFPIFWWYLILMPPISIVPYLYQLHQNPKGIFIFSGYIGLGYTILAGLPLLLGGGLQNVGEHLIGFAVIGHIWFWALLVYYRNGSSFRPHFAFLKKVLKYGWPLIFYAVIQSLTVVVDSAMVQWFYQDKSVFAIFRYGAREFPLVAPLLAGVVSIALPLLVHNRPDGLNMIRKESVKLIRWLFPLAIILMVAAPFLFRWVYSSDFVQSADIFRVYLLLIIPQMLFPQTLVMATKKNQALMMIGWLEVLCNVFLTWTLIQHFGMIGVAWATVIAFALEKMLIIWFIRTQRGPKLGEYTPMTTWFLASMALLITYAATVWIT